MEDVVLITRAVQGEIIVYCKCGGVGRVRVEDLVSKKEVEVECNRNNRHKIKVGLCEVVFIKVRVAGSA